MHVCKTVCIEVVYLGDLNMCLIHTWDDWGRFQLTGTSTWLVLLEPEEVEEVLRVTTTTPPAFSFLPGEPRSSS